MPNSHRTGPSLSTRNVTAMQITLCALSHPVIVNAMTVLVAIVTLGVLGARSASVDTSPRTPQGPINLAVGDDRNTMSKDSTCKCVGNCRAMAVFVRSLVCHTPRGLSGGGRRRTPYLGREFSMLRSIKRVAMNRKTVCTMYVPSVPLA